MIWTLYSFTQVFIPLEPFTEQYSIGIAENDRNERIVVQIKEKNGANLTIGTKGSVSYKDIELKSVAVFTPV